MPKIRKSKIQNVDYFEKRGGGSDFRISPKQDLSGKFFFYFFIEHYMSIVLIQNHYIQDKIIASPIKTVTSKGKRVKRYNLTKHYGMFKILVKLCYY